MNLFSRIKTALGMSAAKPIVAAGDAVLAAGVKAAMSTEIGAAAATAIQSAEVPGATGAAKKAQAVEAAAPAVGRFYPRRDSDLLRIGAHLEVTCRGCGWRGSMTTAPSCSSSRRAGSAGAKTGTIAGSYFRCGDAGFGTSSASPSCHVAHLPVQSGIHQRSATCISRV